VVVSLWSVDDRATAVLMERFYRGLLVEGLPPAEALRQAQLALWRDPRWSDPFYWAGFVIEGDGLNKTRFGGSP
jgi:CHAT domain-containing protein